MPTRKIKDPDETWAKPPCTSPEHYPPTHQYFDPGTYEHTCPSCGNVLIFHVDRARWSKP